MHNIFHKGDENCINENMYELPGQCWWTQCPARSYKMANCVWLTDNYLRLSVWFGYQNVTKPCSWYSENFRLFHAQCKMYHDICPFYFVVFIKYIPRNSWDLIRQYAVIWCNICKLCAHTLASFIDVTDLNKVWVNSCGRNIYIKQIYVCPVSFNLWRNSNRTLWNWPASNKFHTGSILNGEILASISTILYLFDFQMVLIITIMRLVIDITT